ncbi:MAG: copper chaperone PCu(A)C [Alphaproteobacteria bacterium]
MTIRNLSFMALVAGGLAGLGVPALAEHHAASAMAEEVRLGPLTITDTWARARIGLAPNSAAYFTIENTGARADRLLGAASPAAASVELHEHVNADGVMQMRPVAGGIPVAAGAKTSLKPGGYHVMLIGLTGAFDAGTVFPLTLTFEQAGTITLTVPVKSLRSGGMGGHTGH